MSASAEWLASVKAGDEVIVSSHGYGRPRLSVHPVRRVTQTLIVVASGSSETRFNRKSGRATGDSGYGGRYIEETTPERLDEVRTENRRAALAERCRTFTWKDVPLAKLERIVVILNEPAP